MTYCFSMIIKKTVNCLQYVKPQIISGEIRKLFSMKISAAVCGQRQDCTWIAEVLPDFFCVPEGIGKSCGGHNSRESKAKEKTAYENKEKKVFGYPAQPRADALGLMPDMSLTAYAARLGGDYTVTAVGDAAPSVTTYPLWVGGTQVTGANAADIPVADGETKTGTASYDADTNTLTLNGYTYEGMGHI